MNAAAAQWEGPLFIVGMPRSGTKLLRALLNQHARIRIPEAETEFLPYLAGWVERHGEPANEREFRALFRRLQGSTYFRYRNDPDPAATCARWFEACAGRYDAATIFETFMRAEVGARPGDGTIWGDKSPAHIRHIGLLRRCFPQGRVVHIVRDVRDYCLSIRKAWNKDILRAADRWGRDVLEAHRQCVAARSQCHELRYEDLVSSPEATLRALCEFLGIEFAPAMTRLARPVENLGDATGKREILARNVRKFEALLTPRELRQVEELGFDAMRAYGYVPVAARGQRHLQGFSLRLRQVKDGIRLALSDTGRRGIPRSIIFHLCHLRTVRR